MYKRDFAILLVSCIAILVSLQNEGTFSFRKAWWERELRSRWVCMDLCLRGEATIDLLFSQVSRPRLLRCWH
jgi:hypothetical protein